ncbi:MAG: LLM class F420-dependent oxidoreductase [Thermomicrobiales bacterium]|nr:LLM class F420-dependent oxidoreductase [Thermomicrobiales bacterium]
MRIGVVFPQTEIGPEPATVRAYAEAVEQVGFSHLLVYDHVLGAGLDNRPDWRGAYSNDDAFHEVFVLFGYLAAITTKLELVTGVLILPQRQTALVAKQAAAIDVLSGGRLRLGVGVGWNAVEYEALGESFVTRGRRIEEQIDVMRKLWTESVVDYSGKYHRIPEAGIKPHPVQQPIPVWMGGYVEATMRRIGRMGDGWFPRGMPDDALRRDMEIIAQSAAEAGRDPAAIGMEGRISLRPDDEARWLIDTEAWRNAGATHLSINTMGQGRSPEDHIQTVLRYAEIVGLSAD